MKCCQGALEAGSVHEIRILGNDPGRFRIKVSLEVAPSADAFRPRRSSRQLSAAGTERGKCKRGNVFCRAAGERRPDTRRDEGREKPKGVLPPRFGGRSGDKAAPDEPGPEWMD